MLVGRGVFAPATPIAVLFYLFTSGFPPHLGALDRFVLVAFALVWLRYSMRIVNLAKSYPGLPDPPPET